MYKVDEILREVEELLMVSIEGVIGSLRCRCLRLHLMCVDIHFVPRWQSLV